VKRSLTAAAVPAALTLVLGAPALAAWVTLGDGSAVSRADALGATTSGSAGSATDSSLRLSWSYDSSALAPTGWEVLRGTRDISTSCVVGGGQLACVDTGLSPSTTYAYSIRAQRGAWRGSATTFTGTTTAAVEALSVSTPSLPDATLGVPYTHSLVASGGTSPYTWSLLSGTLPTGLNLSSAGVVSGTPTTTGTASFTVRVTDSRTPSVSAEKALSLTVGSPAAAPSVTTTSLPGTTQTAAYNATLTASGGVAPLAWSLQAGSSLPAGLTLSGSGTIAGAVGAQATTTSFTVLVTDALNRSAARSLSINVATAPVVSTAVLPAVGVGATYSQTLAASGGSGSLSWSLGLGSTLPAGLALSTAGVISGTPTAHGAVSFSVRVTDTNGVTATRGLTLTVNPAPAITSAARSVDAQNAPQSVTVTGTAFAAGATVTITNASSSLSISGTTVTATTVSFSVTAPNNRKGSYTLTVTNPDGGKAAQAFTVN
jgi:hypothetical protein